MGYVGRQKVLCGNRHERSYPCFKVERSFRTNFIVSGFTPKTSKGELRAMKRMRLTAFAAVVVTTNVSLTGGPIYFRPRVRFFARIVFVRQYTACMRSSGSSHCTTAKREYSETMKLEEQGALLAHGTHPR